MGARPIFNEYKQPRCGQANSNRDDVNYQVTARKWRPRQFDQMVGQEHITTTLSNAVSTGRIAHCYLFCGPRGTGKTTTARILAKMLNCSDPSSPDPCDACASCTSIAEGTSMDVLEIDGASNNSVDDVRELREVVRYVPTGGAHKIYIIDEIHMLSTAAFNALLKTLEEPPEKVVFVFATTEVQEVPQTILSRCQRFNFRRIPTTAIAAHLSTIAQAEGIEAEEEALFLLAQRADGAMRDAESLMDQVVSFEHDRISEHGVRQVLGLVDGRTFFELDQALSAGESAQVLEIVSNVVEGGGDLEEFVRGFTEHSRHLLSVKIQGSDAAQLEVADAERVRLVEAAEAFAEEDLLRILQMLLDLEDGLRRSAQPRFRVELALVRAARMGRAVDVATLLRKLESMPPPPLSPRGPAARVPDTSGAPPKAAAKPNPLLPDRPEPQPPTSSQPPVAASVSPSEPPPPAGETEPAGDSEPAQAQPSTSTGAVDEQAVRDNWGRIVDGVMQAQRMLGSFLQEGTVERLEGSVLWILFDQAGRFNMSQVDKNRAVVEEVCEQVLGVRLRVQCKVSSAAQGTDAPTGETSAGASKAAAKAGDSSAQVDPRVKSVLDTFDGELV